MLEITLIGADGCRHVVEASVGETLMRVATRNGVYGIDADCGGSCACATCHVVFDQTWFEKVGEPGPTEGALLDMVPESSEMSRLSCQIRLTASLDGLTARVPAKAV